MRARRGTQGRLRNAPRCGLPSALPHGLVAVALLAAPGIGCGGGSGETGGGGSSGPVRGGTVVVALGQEPESFIPYGTRTTAASRVQGFMFRMLAETDPNFADFSPRVARSWSWSDDHKILTMHLRDDVYWSDGVQLTAADVAFTWDVARDTVVAWRSGHWKRHITRCEVVDPFTVRFHFDEVFFEQFRYAKEGFLIPKHLLEDVPRAQWRTCEFARRPIGCGPFKLESYEPGQRIVLVRNELYFDEPKPYLDRVVLEFIPEPSTRVGRLRAGSADLVPDLPLSDAAELRSESVAARSGARVVSVRGRGYDFIGYNSRDPLFTSRRVREALTRAIDRQEIIDALCYGFAEIFESPVVPILWAYDAQQPTTPYDPEGARRLLAEEGWRDTDGDGWLDRDGRRFEFTLITNRDNALRMQAIVPVQGYWRAIGVRANIQTFEQQTALGLRNERKYQAYYGGWHAGLSIRSTLEAIWGCGNVDGKANFVAYCNPTVDSLNALAAQLLDPEEARPLFQEAQRLVAQDHPYTWMYYDHTVVGLSKRLHGIVIDARGTLINMEDWYVPTAMQTARR
ncbi:MAG: ABC transporter substrate-binding protein [Candidatus Krumholzibacteriia bacterium]